MQSDVQELKVVADQFAAKYGKPYAQVRTIKKYYDKRVEGQCCRCHI